MTIINRQALKNKLIGELSRLPPTDQMWTDIFESLASLKDTSTFEAEQKFNAGLDVIGGELKVGGVKVNGGMTANRTMAHPTTSEDETFFITDKEITVSKLSFVLKGSSTPKITVIIRFALDRSAAGTKLVTAGTLVVNTTTRQNVTTFDETVIPAGSIVWIETTATDASGVVDELTASLFAA